MSIHSLLDKISTSVGARFGPKYFRDDVTSPALPAHLKAVKLEFPQVEGEGEYSLTATTLAGDLDCGFRVVQWKGADRPTVIYHHGASEIPFDYGLSRIFPHKKQPIGANLILIRAPLHDTRQNFLEGISTLRTYVAMLAVSVTLIEALIKHLRSQGVTRVVLSGSSLGGFITNLHHIHHNTADAYVPLLAGLAMHEALLHSAYSKAVASKAKENPRHIEKTLDFRAEFAKVDNSNVFPLLGRYDQIIKYDIQKDSYGGCEVATIDKGHVTGAIAFPLLLKHILKYTF